MRKQYHLPTIPDRGARVEPVLRRAGSRADVEGVLIPRHTCGRQHDMRNRTARLSRVLSVGYERRTLDEFIRPLLEGRVSRVIDVRAVAMSRRAAYRKAALAAALSAVGIEYVHVEAAGNPYRAQKDGLRACLAAYRRHLRRKPSAVQAVLELVGSRRVAIFCYERKHEECHRSVLLELMGADNGKLEVVRLE